MRLVDRESQLTALDRMLADTVAGRCRVALVSGALGSGKTALLQTFADRAALTGANFVTATGSWAERGLRFGVLGQIVPGTGLLAACSRLRELAERTPLVIGIDDVDLADQPSLTCLLSLVRRMQPTRVLFLFTECAQVRSTFRVELLRLPHCTQVTLEPLTEHGIAALHGKRDARRIHALSRGNPLLVHALTSDDLPQAVLRCLHRGGPAVRQTAQALAVLGEFATPAAVGRLTGVGERAVTWAVEVLTAAGLLDEGGLRHPGTRDTVLSGTAPVLHARAARLLHEQGAAAELVASHLLDGPPRRQEWAVPVLRTAAARAGPRTVFASRCLELARESSVDPVEQAAVTGELAQLEFRSNPLTAARHLTALRSAPADTKVMLISQLLWHGRVAEARELLPDNDSDVELWLASAHPSLARWRPSASPLTSLLFRDDESAASRAETYLRSARLSGDMPWAAVFALLTLIYSDHLDNAATWCERLLEQAADHVTWQAMFSVLRAEIALRQGDLPACLRLAGIAFGLLSPQAWGTAVVGPLSCLILACTRTGRYAEAGEYVAQPVPEVAFQTRFGPHYLHARGEYHLATARYEAALADFLSCGELMTSWGQDHPGVVPWRACAAQALLGRGVRERARRLLVEQLTLTTRRSRARGHTLYVLAATSDPATRARMLAESADILEERGDRFGLAQTLAGLSDALGHRPRARMTARRAWRVARECGATPLCDRLLPADEPLPERVAALTEAERRVAGLAADGHTNREIARKLFVTTSTVEQHLTRVYRKLDIRHREEIPAGSRRRPRR
ncbi:AAA family ATPase [Lentzea sp. NPDC005914]|uniref:helix-turn-helix transcriptional regulator n=1 Tax=Lentzea sp. NPDC005914 TaxID=3154572 RepID=UPI00340F0AB6